MKTSLIIFSVFFFEIALHNTVYGLNWFQRNWWQNHESDSSSDSSSDFSSDDIDECGSSPCTNGTCVDRVNGFDCSCYPGWTGTLCDLDIDECGSSPCTNGTCVDRVNGFDCSCYPGWTGILCDLDIDECSSSPCINGTCEDRVNGFNCSCYPGWNGTLCDVDIDACDCVNGDCEDRVNGFNCSCDPGWTGTFCDLDKQLSCEQNEGYTYVASLDLCLGAFETMNAEEACSDHLVYVDNPALDQFLYLLSGDLSLTLNTRPAFTNCPSEPIMIDADEDTISSIVTWNDLRISVDLDSSDNIEIKQIDGPAQNTVQEEGSYLVQYEAIVEDTFIHCAFLVQVRVTRCNPIVLCLENGRFNCSQEDTIYGTTCSFTCNVGYQRNGPESTICMSTGLFEEPRPTCEMETPQTSCESKGYTFKPSTNLCFKVFQISVSSQSSAANACELDGGHLIYIENVEMQLAVERFIISNLDPSVLTYFIDGTDQATEGIWKTSAGEVMTYFLWTFGAPFNGSAIDDCLELVTVEGYRWRDGSCNVLGSGYVCQIDL